MTTPRPANRMKSAVSMLLLLALVASLIKFCFWIIPSVLSAITLNYNSHGWVNPNLYKIGDHVELIVNKVESDLTQLPYAYYDLPFICPPTKEKKPLHLSLDEIFRGDRKWQSDYKLSFGIDSPCEILCARKTKKEGMIKAKELVQQGYVTQWLIDESLPAATTFISSTNHNKYYAAGFPVGYVDDRTGKTFLNNHVMLVIRYHPVSEEEFTIVGFEVYPKSVSDYHCPGANKNHDKYEIIVPEKDDELTFIPFTYSVYWREEFEVDWNHRWNYFLNNGELSNSKANQFHWMSFLNSVGIASMTTTIVSIILLKIFSKKERESRNINTSTNLGQDNEDDNDDKISGSVFVNAKTWITVGKIPYWKALICLTSMGIQFSFTILGSLIISCSLSKLHNIRFTVLTMSLICFICGAAISGYIGSRLYIEYQILKGYLRNEVNRTKVYKFSVVCGSSLPGLLMVISFSLNCIILAHDSTNALPFKTEVFLVSIYFVTCIPLSLLGGVLALNCKVDSYNTLKRITSLRRNTISRKSRSDFTKKVSLYQRLVFDIKHDSFTTFGALAGGFFSFIIIWVELQYVYKSVWLEKTSFYYYYGFLLANILILSIVTIEIAIIGCYVMLKAKNDRYLRHTWGWKSFLMGSSCAWYMELYSLYYIFFVLNMQGFSSIFISVCYSLLFNGMCGWALGSLSYLTSYMLVTQIYKVDLQI
ncbi:Transmembrane 9 superfamily member 3 [Nakaseomyces glabratus]|uniref:Transmembrane 9 superfamily member n=1 Tax=Candida glabrata TaxID=5478 RepID=A0A0W0D760_CANGB|nr:Endomembrane protein 70 [Nakaseomyces glabratus]KAH7602268.1 Endomembrane protein 70 [Nakaseomyces glabratus]KAH7613658.1 Endomembrane protein 70 [Nakaseomyces glabratus]KTA95405.1 Transmembrane 9 superfamily member 3 [Nakaseomyces glabratus]KTB07214.1 Transmembrane 9 superfamily member 3 [Nakaseomyces glabratus]